MPCVARSIHDLTLEESFFVWAIRHAPDWTQTRCGTGNEFLTYFGVEFAEAGHIACQHVADGLLHRRAELGACTATELTPLESALLSVVHAIQARNGVVPDLLNTGACNRAEDARVKVLIGCYHFAETSALARRNTTNLPTHRPAPSIEARLVAGLRQWVDAHKQGEDAHVPVADAAGPNVSRKIWQALNTVLRNTSIAARRPVQINCPGCTTISSDEQGLLNAIGALQRHDIGTALSFLCDWQQSAAARHSLAALQLVAEELMLAGHVLVPDRLSRIDIASQADLPREKVQVH